jgi:SPP1 gp7 family putative phage head morphogenesis protein
VLTDDTLGRILLAAESSADAARDLIWTWCRTQYRDGIPTWMIAEDLQTISGSIQDELTRGLVQAELLTYLRSWSDQFRSMPAWLRRELVERWRPIGTPIVPPISFPAYDIWSPEPSIRFPKIDAAAKSLMERGIMTRPQFDAAVDAVRSQAFTVAGKMSTGAIAEVRDVLAELTSQGPSLKEFRQILQTRLQTGLLGPAHVETVFRTNTMAAYRDGRETIMANPVVDRAFPYQAYVATRDARTRPTHAQLETLGLSGTNIYRRDDPFWLRFTPPWDYNCRCSVIPMTVQAAANAGVREAQVWLATERPPIRPEWRYDAIPFPHNPGWGHRRGVAVAA